MGDRFKERYDLNEKIIKSLDTIGYHKPTDVQKQVIMRVLNGEDLVVQADTGSGKTASFGIPIVEKVHVLDNYVQALILTPTRELAVQVSDEIQKLGKYKHIRTLPVYGKQNIDIQIHQLKQRVHVVVGTPGRVIDLVEKEHLKLEQLDMLILDEADELLRRGFLDAVTGLMNQLPKSRQTLLFSATMPEAISDLTKRYMHHPERIDVASEIDEKQLIETFSKSTTSEDKTLILFEVIEQLQPEQCLVFCNTKVDVERIYKFMRRRFNHVEMLHGDLPQKQRLQQIQLFKAGQTKYLVATDLASRGLHIHRLPLVINYDLPVDVQNYTHRIGRTGREGEKGVAISLVNALDIERVQDIEAYLQETLKPLPKSYVLSNNTMNIGKPDDQKKSYQDILKLRISAGKQKKIRVGDVVGALCNLDGITQEDIGVIDIRERYSYVEIFNHKGRQVIEQLNGQTIKNKVVKVEKARGHKELI